VFAIAKEETWHINKVVAVDSAGHGRCTRLFVRSARKSAKSRLNQEKIVRYTVRIVIQSAGTKAVKIRSAKKLGDVSMFLKNIEASPVFSYSRKISLTKRLFIVR